MRLLEIDVVGARDVMGRFARLTSGLKSIMREEVRAWGRDFIVILRREAPKRVGLLREGLGYKTFETASGISLRFTSKMFYTKWVVKGRGPVVAIHAKALRFEPGPPGSGFIFRKRVGPSKPNPFPRRAAAIAKGHASTGGVLQRMAARVKYEWYR